MSDSSPFHGPAGFDFSPDVTFHAKVRSLRQALAQAWATESDCDCTAHAAHAAHHRPARGTGRRVCWLCHPPARLDTRGLQEATP
jgi:hypothetical protein